MRVKDGPVGTIDPRLAELGRGAMFGAAAARAKDDSAGATGFGLMLSSHY